MSEPETSEPSKKIKRLYKKLIDVRSSLRAAGSDLAEKTERIDRLRQKLIVVSSRLRAVKSDLAGEIAEKTEVEYEPNELRATAENDLRDEISPLREALQSAKDTILEQQKMLEELTSPPLLYATVVAVSGWFPKGLKPSYTSIGGNPITVEPGIASLGSYHRGDVLELNTREDIREVVLTAKKLVIVGFTRDGRVVIQLDDGDVIVDNPNSVVRLFRVTEKGSARAATAVIAVEGKYFEVLRQKDIEVQPGDTVSVSRETMQIVGQASVQPGGSIGYLRRVIDEAFSEVDYESSARVVLNGRFGKSLQKGDRVVLDSSGTVIVRNLGKGDERFVFTAETNVAWSDIGGLEEAKRQMIEAVELPHRNPDIFRYYRKRPVKGILLYGPPGCGKTMLGKATATALLSIYGRGSASAFIYIKGPEILDRYVGVAEATVRQIFQQAARHKEAHGYPAVVFIDEADAILGKRGMGISSDMERTIVPMFLAEMDGLGDSGALVILATNRPDILDPAVVRDGRIDRKIRIDRPTPESAAKIFLLNLRGMPLSNGFSCTELAELGSRELFSPCRVLYRIQTRSSGELDFTLGHIINGGMVVSVVDQATSVALHRDLSEGRKGGLRREDLVAAVDCVEQQSRGLNHTDELAEFVHDFREDVVGINRLRQGTA